MDANEDELAPPTTGDDALFPHLESIGLHDWLPVLFGIALLVIAVLALLLRAPIARAFDRTAAGERVFGADPSRPATPTGRSWSWAILALALVLLGFGVLLVTVGAMRLLGA